MIVANSKAFVPLTTTHSSSVNTYMGASYMGAKTWNQHLSDKL